MRLVFFIRSNQLPFCNIWLVVIGCRWFCSAYEKSFPRQHDCFSPSIFMVNLEMVGWFCFIYSVWNLIARSLSLMSFVWCCCCCCCRHVCICGRNTYDMNHANKDFTIAATLRRWLLAINAIAFIYTQKHSYNRRAIYHAYASAVPTESLYNNALDMNEYETT